MIKFCYHVQSRALGQASGPLNGESDNLLWVTWHPTAESTEGGGRGERKRAQSQMNTGRGETHSVVTAAESE